MDKTLIGSKICKTCKHHESACTCEKPHIVPYEEYIEANFHESHGSHPGECYKPFIKEVKK